MKFKYFLRGLGIGIIFASIVCLMAFQGEVSGQLSDEEIIERAKELGMTEPEDQVGDLLKEKENTSEQEASRADSGEPAASKEETTEKEAVTEQQETTETEQTTEENTADKSSETETVELTIERGSSSYPVCQKLQELGMIRDASEFDTYLVENGYASRIRVGTHKLQKGMSYGEIAEAISDPL